MLRPESREIYQMAKMNIEIPCSKSVLVGKPSKVYFEYVSEFDLEFILSMPCRVLAVAKYCFNGDFSYRTHGLDVYNLIVIYKGSVIVKSKVNTAAAGKGDILYIHSVQTCEVIQNGTEPLDLLMLSISGIAPINYYTLIAKNSPFPIHIHSFDILDRLFDKIVYYMKYPTNKNNVLMVDSMSGIFTEMYMNSIGETERDTHYNHTKWFINIIKYIEDKQLRNINISEIAENIGVSESYLHKIFKEYTGVTLYQYLLNLRIIRAKELLSSSDWQIKYISYTGALIQSTIL